MVRRTRGSRSQPQPLLDTYTRRCERKSCKAIAIKRCKKCETAICIDHIHHCPGCLRINKVKEKCFEQYQRRHPFNARVSRLPNDKWILYGWFFLVLLSGAVLDDKQFNFAASVLVLVGFLGFFFYILFRKKYPAFEKVWMKERAKRIGSRSGRAAQIINKGTDTDGVFARLSVLVFPSVKGREKKKSAVAGDSESESESESESDADASATGTGAGTVSSTDPDSDSDPELELTVEELALVSSQLNKEEKSKKKNSLKDA